MDALENFAGEVSGGIATHDTIETQRAASLLLSVDFTAEGDNMAHVLRRCPCRRPVSSPSHSCLRRDLLSMGSVVPRDPDHSGSGASAAGRRRALSYRRSHPVSLGNDPRRGAAEAT